MKCTTKMLKTGLVALFLSVGLSASAQQLITASDQTKLRPPLSGSATETIFAHEKTRFKLTATTTSTATDGEAGITFTNIKWYYKKADEERGALSELALAEAAIAGTANSELTVNGLKPGFYTFMAVGETSGEICSTVPEEFTVFVLPPLTVAVAGVSPLIYCTDDAPATGNTLTATASFGETFNTATPYTTNNPDVSDFELRYRWYKVADGGTLDIGETPLHTSTTSNTYDIVETAVGKWNYYAVVDYTVKSAGPYQAALGGGTPTVIEVTPKPGKPTITIEDLN